MWRAIKVGAFAGLTFAAGTALIAIPIAFFIDRPTGGFLLSVAAGAVFGMAMGLVSYTTGKRFASKIDLANDEHLIHQGSANLVDGKRVSGGWLFLTNQRLLFLPNGANLDNQARERALEDIERVDLSSIYGVLPICICVNTVFDDQGVKYVVESRKRWKGQIDSAIMALPKVKTWAETYYPQSVHSTITADEFIQEHGAFPLPDRSHIRRNSIFASGQVDLGWTRGAIDDGRYERPFFAETWADEGHVTNLTIFFSRIGLEDLTAQQVLHNFRASGLIDGVSNVPCELLRIEDRNAHPIWSINICIGAGETVYVSKALSYQPYRSVTGAYGHCVVCSAERTEPLAGFGARGVPHDQPGHSFVHDYMQLSRCPQCHSGQLEVHSHDCWSHEEPWDMYWWYAIEPSDLETILGMTASTCNTPMFAECDCAWHQAFAQCFKGPFGGVCYASESVLAKRFTWLKIMVSETGCEAVADSSRETQAAVMPCTRQKA